MRLQVNLAPQDAPAILAGLVETSIRQIRQAGVAGQFPVLDGLRDGSIRYVQADPGENWKTWENVLHDRAGDCEDLTAAVAAEYMAAGIFARPVAYQPHGLSSQLWHVVVEVWDPESGTPWYGDPSIMGGMGAP